MRLILASHNQHKAREFERLLPGFEVEPYPGDLPEETGETFRENAELKAVAQKTMLTMHQDALQKAAEGITSLEEIIRVSSGDLLE